MKYLLDTNVYVEGCRSEENRRRFRQAFFPLLPATFFSAVVAYEAANSVNDQTRGLLKEFVAPMQRAGLIRRHKVFSLTILKTISKPV